MRLVVRERERGTGQPHLCRVDSSPSRMKVPKCKRAAEFTTDGGTRTASGVGTLRVSDGRKKPLQNSSYEGGNGSGRQSPIRASMTNGYHGSGAWHTDQIRRGLTSSSGATTHEAVPSATAVKAPLRIHASSQMDGVRLVTLLLFRTFSHWIPLLSSLLCSTAQEERTRLAADPALERRR